MTNAQAIFSRYGIDKSMYKQICILRPTIHQLSPRKIIENTTAMEKYLTHYEIKSNVCRYPKIIEADIDTWIEFLDAYGLPHMHIRNVVLNSYIVIAENSIYHFGLRILNLKSYGFTDEEIKRFYIPYLMKLKP